LSHLGKGLRVWSSNSQIFLRGGGGEKKQEGEQGDEKRKKRVKKRRKKEKKELGVCVCVYVCVVKKTECTLDH